MVNPLYFSGKLDKIDLVSAQCSQKFDRYAVAAIKNGQCHLTPLSTMVQMRPDLGFLDLADASSKARARLLEMEAAGGRSMYLTFTILNSTESKPLIVSEVCPY